MSSHYNITETDSGFEFITLSGNHYFIYFTDFYLQDENGDDLKIYSFGFTCREGDDWTYGRKDPRIKNSIIFILEQFFTKNDDNAIIYICLTNDGLAKRRQLTFGRWFYESGRDKYEKYNSDIDPEHQFYCSVIVKKTNPLKERFIKAFYYSLKIWFKSIEGQTEEKL